MMTRKIRPSLCGMRLVDESYYITAGLDDHTVDASFATRLWQPTLKWIYAVAERSLEVCSTKAQNG